MAVTEFAAMVKEFGGGRETAQEIVSFYLANRPPKEPSNGIDPRDIEDTDWMWITFASMNGTISREQYAELHAELMKQLAHNEGAGG